MRTVLAVLVTLATATAGPATRPAPTSMSLDELRREVVRLRAENGQTYVRLLPSRSRPTTVGRTVITRRVVAVVDRGRVIEVSDTGRKADQ